MALCIPEGDLDDWRLQPTEYKYNKNAGKQHTFVNKIKTCSPQAVTLSQQHTTYKPSKTKSD